MDTFLKKFEFLSIANDNASDIHHLYKGQLSACVHSVGLQLSAVNDVSLSWLDC